jgi:DNA-binding NarL/FixJ family response regulator
MGSPADDDRRLRIVVVEDNVLLAEGLTLLLGSQGCQVVASVATGDAFLAAVDEQAPDLCVVDVRLPPTFTDEGIRAALEARRRRPGLPVLVLSQYVESVYARELLADGGGGVGYLLKDRVSRVDAFVEALHRVATGGSAMDPEVVAQLVARQADTRLEELTPRELEVLELMAQGLGNGEIAAALHVTLRAVHKHVGNVFLKLGLEPSDSGHRRVLAVLAYLESRPEATGRP